MSEWGWTQYQGSLKGGIWRIKLLSVLLNADDLIQVYEQWNQFMDYAKCSWWAEQITAERKK